MNNNDIYGRFNLYIGYYNAAKDNIKIIYFNQHTIVVNKQQNNELCVGIDIDIQNNVRQIAIFPNGFKFVGYCQHPKLGGLFLDRPSYKECMVMLLLSQIDISNETYIIISNYDLNMAYFHQLLLSGNMEYINGIIASFKLEKNQTISSGITRQTNMSFESVIKNKIDSVIQNNSDVYLIHINIDLTISSWHIAIMSRNHTMIEQINITNPKRTENMAILINLINHYFIIKGLEIHDPNDNDIKMFADMLAYNKSLDRLIIYSFTINDMNYIFEALTHNSYLETLDIEDIENPFGIIDDEKLKDMLIYNKSLKYFSIDRNHITPQIIDIILDALLVNSTIIAVHLNTDDNDDDIELDNTIISKYINVLNINKRLIWLDVGITHVPEELKNQYINAIKYYKNMEQYNIVSGLDPEYDDVYIETMGEIHRSNNNIRKKKLIDRMAKDENKSIQSYYL
jgi:hypothetical protein